MLTKKQEADVCAYYRDLLVGAREQIAKKMQEGLMNRTLIHEATVKYVRKRKNTLNRDLMKINVESRANSATKSMPGDRHKVLDSLISGRDPAIVKKRIEVLNRTLIEFSEMMASKFGLNCMLASIHGELIDSDMGVVDFGSPIDIGRPLNFLVTKASGLEYEEALKTLSNNELNWIDFEVDTLTKKQKSILKRYLTLKQQEIDESLTGIRRVRMSKTKEQDETTELGLIDVCELWIKKLSGKQSISDEQIQL